MALQLPDSSSPDEIFLSHDELFSESNSAKPRISWIWIVLSILAAIGIFSLGAWSQTRSIKPNLIGPFEGKEIAVPTPIIVHVAGRVHKPGVYELAFDARVRQAIHQAGGPMPDADLDAINLAAYLEDGQKLEVPSKPAPPKSTSEETAQVLSLEDFADETSGETETASPLSRISPLQKEAKPLSAPPEKRAPAEKKKVIVAPEIPRAKTGRGQDSQNADPEYFKKNPLNINTAAQGELELLPGIGPMLAERIVAYRTENGKFETLEELGEVNGIGAKRLEQLTPLVTAD